jgi:hypothetical protein
MTLIRALEYEVQAVSRVAKHLGHRGTVHLPIVMSERLWPISSCTARRAPVCELEHEAGFGRTCPHVGDESLGGVALPAWGWWCATAYGRKNLGPGWPQRGRHDRAGLAL